MKKAIKKIIEVILTIFACLSFVLMVGEKADGSACIPWTLGCLAVLIISGYILGRMGAFKNVSQ